MPSLTFPLDRIPIGTGLLGQRHETKVTAALSHERLEVVVANTDLSHCDILIRHISGAEIGDPFSSWLFQASMKRFPTESSI